MFTTTRSIRFQLAGAVLAVAGVFATSVQAAPEDGRMLRMQMAGGPMGQGGPGAMMGGPMGYGGGPGAMHGGYGGPGAMMGGMLYRLLDQVNTTPEQRARIKQIMDRSSAEMQAQRETGRALRDEAMALFSQPTIDAKAAEALRQKQMAHYDAASQRMLQSMLEISSVLTPEQRKQMADHMQKRRDMMQRHQRERQGLDGAKS